MSRESDIFFKAASDEGYVVKKHNETDYDNFRKFQEEIDQRYVVLEKERIINERKNNLLKWMDKLPERWKDASLAKIIKDRKDDDRSAEAATRINEILSSDGKGSFFLSGQASSGKTYLAYAVARKYITKGWTTPSQVKIISEESMLNLAYSGFIGRDRFEKLLDDQYNMYIFDNVGEKEQYDPVKEISLWERMIDHIYNNSLSAVFTSTFPLENFTDNMSESIQAKMIHLVDGRMIEVYGSSHNSLKIPVKTKKDKENNFKDLPLDSFEG